MRLYILATIFSMTFFAAAFAQEPSKCPDDQTRLEISSQSEIKATPDTATISAGVVTVAKTASQAMQDNATKMSTVFAAIKKAGIDDKDVQTSGIALNPQYQYAEKQPPQIVNYQATNTVTIKIRDLKNISSVFDQLIAQGINQLNGPNFLVDNPDRFMDTARADAVKKAMIRAKTYADAAGLKVKRIISMSEQTGYMPPQPIMAMRAMDAKMEAASVPVATGQVEMSVTLNTVFELE